MPRRTLKRWLPHASTFKESKSLQFLGHLLHEPGLWHLNRRSVSKAFFIGLFTAMLPIPGQMVVAATLAILRNANLPISVSLVWITNPLTMPPIFYFNYFIGNHILATPVTHSDFTLSLHWLNEQINTIWWPLLAGSMLVGILLATFGSLLISGLWHLNVRRQWRKRSMKHQDQG